ncbi:hypothetical protein NQ318_022292 [Aromia moschata]|uniref:Phosphoribosylglycinamide synthetase C-domain domain-containing protein n=1 Tax=Aromia moschata TaxID=1265417 RepID=A0AAV8Z671_9CUCU|nr:hypothetical protein NQ318_022292 [Aromia moschata]
MSKNVLVIGGGGREHAIVWKFAQSERVRKIFAAPGSFAIQQVAKANNVDLDVKNFKAVVAFCKSENVDLVVIGPEDPLANGIVDFLTIAGVKCFGPCKDAARIESDKDWAKAFMDRHQIPTARWKSFNNAREAKEFINKATFDALVVKASGLAADLYDVVESCLDGTLANSQLKWKENLSAVGVVMASRGYPETSSKGQVITGIETVDSKPHHVVFHCGTALKDDNLVTNGGRVLIAVSMAPQLATAAVRATQACDVIRFEGEQHRRDIAHKGIASPLRSQRIDRESWGGLGGFGGLFDLKTAGYKDPLLVSGTDGVGTKLKIAQEMGVHHTIGIDLVAMCVNDILAHGAEPLFFLDYFGCGSLDVNVAQQVVTGIAEGCRQAGCSLIGGETAEMPDMYPPGEYDLAGFAVGAVERDQLMPNQLCTVEAGDSVIVLPSTGLHSNGFSLARRVMKLMGVAYSDVAPFSKEKRTFGEELLTPTKIYVRPVLPALRSGKNVPRVLPEGVAVELDARQWPIPPVFPWLAAAGGINENELLRTFNCGAGAVLIVKNGDAEDVLKTVESCGGRVAGKVTRKAGERVVVHNFSEAMDRAMRPYIPELVRKHAVVKKKVGVLISGSGTNLQALIDAAQDPTRHLGAEIVLVISNKQGVEGLKRAERAGIPTKVLIHKNYPNRAEFDRAMHEELVEAGVEIVCLAGFMHPHWRIHGEGVEAQRQALEAGVRVSGCTVHFVEEDVDAGAIIVQETVPIEVGDTVDVLVERIKTAEHRAFPRALQLLATGKIRLGADNKIIWS